MLNLRLFPLPPIPRAPHMQLNDTHSLTHKLLSRVLSPSRHQHLALSLQVCTHTSHITHYTLHIPSSASLALALGFPLALFQGPGATTKCESPTPALLSPMTSSDLIGKHRGLMPCPDPETDNHFLGQVVSSKGPVLFSPPKGKPLSVGT